MREIRRSTFKASARFGSRQAGAFGIGQLARKNMKENMFAAESCSAGLKQDKVVVDQPETPVLQGQGPALDAAGELRRGPDVESAKPEQDQSKLDGWNLKDAIVSMGTSRRQRGGKLLASTRAEMPPKCFLEVISVAFRNWLIRNVDLVKATFECKFRVFPEWLDENAVGLEKGKKAKERLTELKVPSLAIACPGNDTEHVRGAKPMEWMTGVMKLTMDDAFMVVNIMLMLGLIFAITFVITQWMSACSRAEVGAASFVSNIKAGLRPTDVLHLHRQQTDVMSVGRHAFAAVLGDGSVVTWGDAVNGGDSSAVEGRLRDVQHIQSSLGAFAAILTDGSVVTWGERICGGDSAAVQGQLRDVKQIQSSAEAFAAILGDGSVVTWGNSSYGGDSRAVERQLRDVKHIQSSSRAFAAIRGDGSVVSWGDLRFGGDSRAVQEQLRDVQHIQSSSKAFAAILSDGSVVTWGGWGCNPSTRNRGGDVRAVQGQLNDVKHIQSSDPAFAAILADGSVVTWGNPDFGVDSSIVQGQLRDVQQIQSSEDAFAAILSDGSVVTWGNSRHGGDSSIVQGQLRDVQHIQSSWGAFAAIRGDGSVVSWGDPHDGGDSSAIQGQLRDVKHIQSSSRAFAAIRADGSVVTWGNPDFGGDSSAVQGQLRDVKQIQSSAEAFAAILSDGSIVTWGYSRHGGDSSAVQEQLRMLIVQSEASLPTLVQPVVIGPLDLPFCSMGRKDLRLTCARFRRGPGFGKFGSGVIAQTTLNPKY
ncbi:HERC2 [Symbiodinium sp. KB8]|nr:HERC2 [Symbiodinium sp. KB8]